MMCQKKSSCRFADFRQEPFFYAFLRLAYPATSTSPERFFLTPLSTPKRLISAETTRRDPRQGKNRQIIIDTGEIPNARERGDFCTYYHCIISNLDAGNLFQGAARRPYLVFSRCDGSCQGPPQAVYLALTGFGVSAPRPAGRAMGLGRRPSRARSAGEPRPATAGKATARGVPNCGRARAARRG